MEREQWNSRLGFLAAAIGSAIGLGNIWRFSYVCYENGGGAFLIPYVVALLTAGIPILILEYGLGHRLRGSAPASLRRIGKGWELLGWWAVVFVMFGIELYYTAVIGWCVDYFGFSFTLRWGSDPDGFFFGEFLKVSDSPGELGRPLPIIVLGLAVVWFVNWLITARGIQRGVELACKVFMPLLFVLTLILVVRGVTLPNAAEGIKTYLRPDFSKLADHKVWMAAYGQIFFSLSVGFGIMIAYASYLPEDADISTNAIITGVVNCLYSFIAGFAVFGTLGFMAAKQGKPMADVVTKSLGLAFVAYPEAISQMHGVGRLIGPVFFLTLIVAGLSSSISILEAFASAVQDKFHVSRFRTCTTLCIVGFLGSLIFTTRGGLHWLDILNEFLNSYGLVTVGLLQCVLVAAVLGPKLMRDHINATSDLKIGRWWDVCVCFVAPIILLVILGTSLYSVLTEGYGGYTRTAVYSIGFGWLAATVVIAAILSGLPWKKEPAPHTALKHPEDVWPPDADGRAAPPGDTEGDQTDKPGGR